MRHYFRTGPRYSPSRAPSLSPAVGPFFRADCAFPLALLLWSGVHILLLLAKDCFNKAIDFRALLLTPEYQPDDVFGRDQSKVALKSPSFYAPSFTMKESVQGIVGEAVAVTRQKISEIKINLELRYRSIHLDLGNLVWIRDSRCPSKQSWAKQGDEIAISYFPWSSKM